jgi:hypothetical protein
MTDGKSASFDGGTAGGFKTPARTSTLFRRIIRRTFYVVGGLVVLLLLVYAEENWRGKRAWTNYRRELQARGEPVDVQGIIPPKIPDDQNFAAIPRIQRWFPRLADQDADWPQIYTKAAQSVPKENRNQRVPTDLVAWKQALETHKSATNAADGDAATKVRKSRPSPPEIKTGSLDADSRATAAPAVLAALKVYEADIEEFRAASSRPLNRYPIAWDTDNPAAILLPHLARVKAAVQLVSLRASAELAAGDGAKALEDVRLGLRLADSLKDEPILISFLVRIACLQIITQPVWEGLTEHRWNETQAAALQSRFSGYNVQREYESALKAERVFGNGVFDYIRRKKSLEILDAASESIKQPYQDIALHLLPAGWFYLEQLNYNKLYDHLVQNAPASTGDDELRDAQILPEITENPIKLFWHHRILARLMLPALGRVHGKAIRAETNIRQTMIACALERFRLEHGNFPERLTELGPKFLPRIPEDVCSGEPMKYERRAAGTFVLYSIGLDRKDDGGQPGKNLFADKGDWVWSNTTQAL